MENGKAWHAGLLDVTERRRRSTPLGAGSEAECQTRAPAHRSTLAQNNLPIITLSRTADNTPIALSILSAWPLIAIPFHTAHAAALRPPCDSSADTMPPPASRLTTSYPTLPHATWRNLQCKCVCCCLIRINRAAIRGDSYPCVALQTPPPACHVSRLLNTNHLPT